MKLSEKIKDKAILERVNLIGKYFKYFSQFNIDAVEVKIPIERVSAVQLVNEFCKEFYKLAVVSDKLNIDIVQYLRYFIIIKHFSKFQISKHLVSKQTILNYLYYKQHNEKLNNVYQCYVKSIKYVAHMCIINNQRCKEYLIDTIKNNKLLPLFLSGKISIYFLAAMPNFKQIILKFDKEMQKEFKHLYDNFERYNSEINEACLVVRNIKANPIKNVNSVLFQISSSLS